MQSCYYMQKAILKAWQYQFLTYPNPAVGACVVQNGKILSIKAHQKAGDPHAEVNAIKSAFLKLHPNSKLKDMTKSSDIHTFLLENHNGCFEDCQIYVTLEPCNHIGKTPSCAMLLEQLRFQKTIIATLDINQEATGGLIRLQKANLDVEIGICKEEAKELLTPFRLWQKKNFKFFKIAMREDGSIDGGYITSQDSLDLVHHIRTKIDLLVIGGNTVRTDRPTLDTRFVDIDKNPDILIYSSNPPESFDKTIPLFGITNRKVTISKSLEMMNEANFIMIEGGYHLFENIKNQIDMVMVFMSHKNSLPKKIDIEKKFGLKQIHSYFLNETDEIIFLKMEEKV